MHITDMSHFVTTVVTCAVAGALWAYKPNARTWISAYFVASGIESIYSLAVDDWSSAFVVTQLWWIGVGVAAVWWLTRIFRDDHFREWSQWWPTKRRAISDMSTRVSRKADLVQHFTGTIIGVEQNIARHSNACCDRLSECTMFIVETDTITTRLVRDGKTLRVATVVGRTIKVLAPIGLRLDETCELPRMEHDLRSGGAAISGNVTLPYQGDVTYEHEIVEPGDGSVLRYSDEHPVGKALN